MKLRTILLSSVFLVALVASFGFSPVKRNLHPADWIYFVDQTQMCMHGAGTYANEPTCGSIYTGALCTVTPGALPTRTAYTPAALTYCTYPLRQP